MLHIFLATNHPQVNRYLEMLETEKGIRELERLLRYKDLSKWAKPIEIIGEALYKERLLEKAKTAKPDVIVLYDKLPGSVEMKVILEEIRLEIKNIKNEDTRVIFLTSLEQGSVLLRRAVEIGVWDIVAGTEIYPQEIIKKIFCPTNFSEVARFRLAPEDKSCIKYTPVLKAEKKEEEPLLEPRCIRVEPNKGLRETILFWSPFEAGKTFLAVNMSVALAHSGFKTMLIDADLENSSVESFFAGAEEKEHVFLKCLKERSGAEEALTKCFTYRKNLYVFPLPWNKLERITVTEDEFIFFYDMLRKEIDFFIIDGSKNLENVLTRAALKIATRVIVPVTEDQNRAKMLRSIVSQLNETGVGIHKFEFILNMSVNEKRQGKREIEEILGHKLMDINIPAILDCAFQSISLGKPAYELGDEADCFAQRMEALAAYLNKGVHFSKPLTLSKRILNMVR